MKRNWRYLKNLRKRRSAIKLAKVFIQYWKFILALRRIKLNIIRKVHIIWILKNLIAKKKKIECLIFIMKTLFFLTNYPNFVVNKHIIFPKIYKYIIRLRKVCVPLSENSRIRAILYLLLLFWIMKIMY